MQIRTVTANNFKSLIDFKLDLAKFTCLIGLNGAGKSTVLQFMDFLAQQVRGEMKTWLQERHWQPRELSSRLTSKKNIFFSASLTTGTREAHVRWTGRFNTTQLHCTAERLETPGAILEVQDGRLRIVNHDEHSRNGREVVNEPIAFSYEGSVLSQLRTKTLAPWLVRFKDFMANVKSLDLLAPQYLRMRTRESEGSIGLGGQRLSAFLHELGEKRRAQLGKRLRKVYKHLHTLQIRSLQSGWKQLEIQENYGGKTLTTEAQHMNDGMLRLIAILAELQNEDYRVLQFDEIENGINPELVEFVIDALTSAPQQILVTTHSPMILNYLEDDIAKAGVIYLYRTAVGSTQAVPFFSIPSLAKKLTVMGPGEAFVDTDLTKLAAEIDAMTSME
jgi:predicted ATPase